MSIASLGSSAPRYQQSVNLARNSQTAVKNTHSNANQAAYTGYQASAEAENSAAPATQPHASLTELSKPTTASDVQNAANKLLSHLSNQSPDTLAASRAEDATKTETMMLAAARQTLNQPNQKISNSDGSLYLLKAFTQSTSSQDSTAATAEIAPGANNGKGTESLSNYLGAGKSSQSQVASGANTVQTGSSTMALTSSHATAPLEGKTGLDTASATPQSNPEITTNEPTIAGKAQTISENSHESASENHAGTETQKNLGTVAKSLPDRPDSTAPTRLASKTSPNQLVAKAAAPHAQETPAGSATATDAKAPRSNTSGTLAAEPGFGRGQILGETRQAAARQSQAAQQIATLIEENANASGSKNAASRPSSSPRAHVAGPDASMVAATPNLSPLGPAPKTGELGLQVNASSDPVLASQIAAASGFTAKLQESLNLKLGIPGLTPASIVSVLGILIITLVMMRIFVNGIADDIVMLCFATIIGIMLVIGPWIMKPNRHK